MMKLICIYQTHILHPSVNKSVTAGEDAILRRFHHSSTSYRDTNVRSMNSE